MICHTPTIQAAALVAAAAGPTISAIVSRGGRSDLAGNEVLSRIETPTLLIVGENDEEVIKLNQKALIGLTKIQNKKKLVIIQGATHLSVLCPSEQDSEFLTFG